MLNALLQDRVDAKVEEDEERTSAPAYKMKPSEKEVKQKETPSNTEDEAKFCTSQADEERWAAQLRYRKVVSEKYDLTVS
jgi:hypothetical protein